MQELKFGNYKLVQYTAQEYAEEFDVDLTQERYAGATHMMWLEKLDNAGEVIGMSMEVMYIYEDNTFAYTNRWLTCKADLSECLDVISWIEEL